MAIYESVIQSWTLYIQGGKNTSGYEIFANKFAGSGDEKMLIEDPVCSWQETPNTKSNIENTCMTLCNKDEKGGSTVTSLETHVRANSI